MIYAEPPEAALERLMHRLVQARGGMAVKLAPTIAGVPDRLIVLGGAMHLVELKTRTGRLSPVQKAIHSRLADLGVPVTTLYGSDEVRYWVTRASRGPLDDEDD